MKGIKQFLPFILLSAILIFQLLNYCSDQAVERDSQTDTLYVQSNDHFHEIPFRVEVPKPYKVEVPVLVPGATSTITIPTEIDSLAVVIDYYTKRYYEDTLKNDSIEIRLRYAAYKNRIIDRQLWYKWTAKTMVLERTVNRQLAFVGIDAVFPEFGFYPSIYFDTKNWMYGAGIDPFKKNFKVGVYRKFSLWKKRR